MPFTPRYQATYDFFGLYDVILVINDIIFDMLFSERLTNKRPLDFDNNNNTKRINL